MISGQLLSLCLMVSMSVQPRASFVTLKAGLEIKRAGKVQVNVGTVWAPFELERASESGLLVRCPCPELRVEATGPGLPGGQWRAVVQTWGSGLLILIHLHLPPHLPKSLCFNPDTD